MNQMNRNNEWRFEIGKRDHKESAGGGRIGCPDESWAS